MLVIQRNVRYLAVLFSGILVNLSITALVAYLLGIDIHLYTIAGITISFGLIVDNAIVMLDHLHRRGSTRVFVRYVFERSGYREPEETKLYVNAELPFGHTLEQMDAIIERVEDYLQTVRGIEQFVTQVHSGQYAEVVITFAEAHQRGSLPYQLKSQLIAQSLDWGGVEWDVYGVGEGFSNSTGENLPSFRVEMQGYNYDALEQQAQVLSQKLLSHKRIREVDINARLSYDEKSSQEYVLGFDPSMAGLLATDPNSIADQLQEISPPTAPALHINYQDQHTPVYLKAASADTYARYQLTNGPLALQPDQTIPLGAMSTLTLDQTTNAIHKKNRQYIRMVGFDYFGSNKFGGEYLDEVLAEMKDVLPVGYEVKEIEAWSWNSDRTQRQYGLLAVLIVAVYFICTILLENLRQPLFIIATYPISLIGLFLTFSLFDFYFDQGGYAAFVLLGGLVVNAAIFVVNDLNGYAPRSRRQYNRAVIKAVGGKATPILLTLFSTCFGLVPFLIEGQHEVFWFSLAVGTIGGLLFSLLAIFVCLPTFLFYRERTRK